jgi:hypothetical protein
MRAQEFLTELQLPKNQWTMLVANADKEEVGHELVDLVKHAYSNTPQGSFVHSIRDVVPSDWKIIDWDQDPDVDACVFYRGPRGNENWRGFKIQGIGHDGARPSKDRVIAQQRALLDRNGWWAESSDAMRHIMKKHNAPTITDVEFLRALFNDPNLQMVSEDTYVRVLPSGTKITETVFGKPVLRHM